MSNYLVIWRGDDEILQSAVETDTMPSTYEEWVRLAASSEGFKPNEVDDLIASGFDLYAVIRGPVDFVV